MHVKSCPIAIVYLHKIAPDLALVGVWAVKSTLFLHHLLGICCSLSAPGQLKQISKMGISLSGFTSWVPCELPFLPGCWWSSSHWWNSDCHLLKASGISSHCSTTPLSLPLYCVHHSPGARLLFHHLSPNLPVSLQELPGQEAFWILSPCQLSNQEKEVYFNLMVLWARL